MFPLKLICTIFSVTTVHSARVASNAPLVVDTASGTLHGFINSSAPSVRQFLGVPFALPPTGARRWLPPAPITSPTTLVNATAFGPSCPQIPLRLTPTPDVYSTTQTEFFPLEDFSEDCLTLNVWAPLHPTSAALPVLVFIFGGAFLHGGAHALYFDAAPWVQRTQAHVVITVNFRSNIFGFPNAPGLGRSVQNLGLLDQRAALAWVHANIGVFGGDAARIVDWGESGGAIATDVLHFAFPDDPIVHGSIMDSGSALFPTAGWQSTDAAQTNFTQVAMRLGCGADAAAQLDCLRASSWQAIEAVLLADPSLRFLPIPDARVVFADYPARYASGAFARVPALIGTNAHEFNALFPARPDVDALSNATFLCTAATTARLRQTHGLNLTTYRFRYDGDFANISPPAFPGAYHAAELPLVFGTAGQYHGALTVYEEKVGDAMQDLWLEFARDPEGGLKAAGWESYGAGKAVITKSGKIRFRLVRIMTFAQ